jgi:hypothetical protein
MTDLSATSKDDFSHIPESGDHFPIEPPPDGSLDAILRTIADFFAGIGRGIKHIFSDHYCELKPGSFILVGPGARMTIDQGAGFAPAHGKKFTVTAEFNSDGAECGCCEYRQFIRGTVSKNGMKQTYMPGVAGGQLHESIFREDGVFDESTNTRTPRGHRDLSGSNVDQYKPNQKTGCRYETEDTPQCPLDMEMHLQFIGMIIDTCEGRVIDIKTWSVDIP